MSNPLNIENAVRKSDLVIGAVLIPGAKAPKLVSEAVVKQMKSGSVIVDIAIDQGVYLKQQIKYLRMINLLMLSMEWYIMRWQICPVQYLEHQQYH